jgi:hypothetical protein
MNKDDLFYKLINEGTLIISGCNNELESYRIIEYQGKIFKIILEANK